MLYLIIWSVSNKVAVHYEMIVGSDLAKRLDELQKKEKAPKITLYEIRPVNYTLSYKDIVEAIAKKRVKIEVRDEKGIKKNY